MAVLSGDKPAPEGTTATRSQSHKLSTEETADTAVHAPRGPLSMDPQSRENQVEGGAAGGAVQEVETFSKSLGKVVRGCTGLLTQPQL